LALHSPGGAPGRGDERLFGLSLCSGVGGLDLGILLACPGYRALGYVEREAYAAAVLVARMEDAALDRAVVWDDVGTFDGIPWRRGGHPQRRISVPAILGRRPATRRGGPAPPLAARRSHHRRGRAALRLPRERRPSSAPRISRGRRRTGRHGLPTCGWPLHGGRGRRAPPARAALHPRPPRRRCKRRPGTAAGRRRWRATAKARGTGRAGGRSRRAGITTGGRSATRRGSG
jgi:hypothetical protein